MGVLLAALVFPTAWTVWYRDAAPVWTYALSADFCDELLPRFRGDYLSLQPFGCDELRSQVRRGLDVWTHNARAVAFVEEDAHRAEALFLPGHPVNDSIARVYLFLPRAEVVFSVDGCWYTDPGFCHAVHRDAVWLHVALVVVWFGCLAALLFLRRRLVVPSVRLALLVGILSPPWIYFGAVLPCLQCHDFAATVAHEAGHLLGLHHPGDNDEWCGCGSNASWSCYDVVADDKSLMLATARPRASACLGMDDAHGVRTLHSPADCELPTRCYETGSIGAARIAVALLVSTGVAWILLVAWRVVTTTARRRKSDDETMRV